ncbi:hypothetical protein AB205_0001920 [Aquarana catesbeiana]|uniref:Immunoglobulin C1-set domain-containing protein n=1 Tax=Aquarana catesbeiana TaxID=8400 RepID=A0A2G9P1D9_AQUCT|nr:hypothetical protein AB205_0001920 [Aquarana catesbeiana]
MYPVVSDGMYRITTIPLERQSDKLYGYKSCVTFSPSLERDQGVEYICRVEHPSLEQPIERSTGALQVTAPEQLYSGVPPPVFHHPSPQDVSNIVEHQHHPSVPAPEPHHPTPQDMLNIMIYHNPLVVPAPEPHHPMPWDVSNFTDHQNHPGVQAPEYQHSPQQVVYNIMDHQHQTGAPPLDPHHHLPPEVYNTMHHQNHPGVLASESQHPYPQDVYDMFSHPHYPSAPAPESHHPHLEYMNNIAGHHITPISQQHCSPLPCNKEEGMDFQDNSLQHNVVEHREELVNS